MRGMHVLSNTHRRRRRNSTVELRRVGVGGVYLRRLPTDSVDNLKTDQTDSSGLTTWILIDIDNVFNNDVIMSSLVTNLNSSTAQEIVKLDHDYCRVRSYRRRDSTRQLSRVGGVYWTLSNTFLGLYKGSSVKMLCSYSPDIPGALRPHKKWCVHHTHVEVALKYKFNVPNVLI